MEDEHIRWAKEPQEGNKIIRVCTSQQLAHAVGQAVPGWTIVLEDGIYRDAEVVNIRIQAPIEEPVTIRAANPGRAIISGAACIKLHESSYVMIQGIKFANTGHTAIELNDCHHIRITRNSFALAEDGTELHWILIRGENSHHHWIDHNDFGPRRDKGMYVSSDGANGKMSQYDVYEYNYFHGSGPAFPRSLGEIKALRIGLSKVSMSDGCNLIQYNLFEHCDANPEIISLKSCRNRVRYNTFVNCEGHLTSRHGHANSFYGNIFLGDGKRNGMGGFRIYGNDHQIHDNVLVNLTDWAVRVDSGAFDAGPEGNIYTPEVLTQHWRVYRAQVYGNVIEGGPGITIGGSKQYEPVDVSVENNLYRGRPEEAVVVHASRDASLFGNRIETWGGQQGCPSSWKEHIACSGRMKVLTPADVGPGAI